MTKKHTIDFVRQRFEEEGYKLLATEYRGSQKSLGYICSAGHRDSGTWTNWQQGRRCYYCGRDRIKKLLTLNFHDIKKSFEDEDYILLSTSYKNATEKLNFICPNGHRHSISWSGWRQGERCTYCWRKRSAESQRLDIDYVKQHFDKENYKLLSSEYQHSHEKLNYICPVGHENSMTWNKWQSGRRCPTCANIRNGIRISGSNHPLWRGGIANAPYCVDWTKEYKNYIKERDGYVCLNPSCSKEFSDLHVHHVNYNKEDCDRFNLITLCVSCNSKANKDRKWHKAWYQAIIHRRYREVTK